MALVWSEYGRNMGAIWKMKNSKKNASRREGRRLGSVQLLFSE